METTTQKQLFRRLEDHAPMTIPAVDGQRLIVDAKELFTHYIDKDFKDWGLTKKVEPTPETDTALFTLDQWCMYKAFFGSFDKGLDALCFTQDQIIAFCEKHKNELRLYRSYCFLTKQDGKFFVVHVNVYRTRDLDASVGELKFDEGRYTASDSKIAVVPATAL